MSAVWFAYRACGCLNFCANCSLPLASPPSNPSQYSVHSPQKKRAMLPSFLWRRERDSNPRIVAHQRFSRPPHSTALPSFHVEITENRQFYSVLRFPSFNRLISSAFQDRRVRPLRHLCKTLYYFSRAARRCQLIFMHESCPKARGKNNIAFICHYD